MKTEAVEKELLSLERKYWKAIQDKDFESALELTDFPCIVAGASGVGSIDRPKFEAMMKNAKYDLLDFEVKDDAEVRMLANDIAIIAYKVREKLSVEGKPVTLEASDASTWVKRNGRWVCALHTESLKGDPFGRDRKTAS